MKLHDCTRVKRQRYLLSPFNFCLLTIFKMFTVLQNDDIILCLIFIVRFSGKFQLHILPKCGHAVHEDDPGKVC